MTRYLSMLTMVVLALGVALTAGAADKEKEKKFSAKCPVSGKAAKEASFVEYKGGKVYFCCDGCPAAFKKNTEKFATKANHQLAATGQAKLIKCPIAGRKLNPATKIKVAGVDVCFCCNGCKGKVLKAEGDAQVALIFNDKAFAKAFKVGKGKKKE